MKQPEPLAEQINRVAPKLPDNSSLLFKSLRHRIEISDSEILMLNEHIKILERQNAELKMIIEKLQK